MSNEGRFVWYELMTTDMDAAKAFYSEVIGWKTAQWPDASSGMPPYTMWQVGDDSIGGVMTLPDKAKEMGVPPHWLVYVQVIDVDATAARAKELGGTVHVPPTDIPTVGRFAVIADPQGASLAAFKPQQEMKLHEGEPRLGDFSWHELNSTDHEAGWKFYSELFDWKLTDAMDMGPEMGTYQMFNRTSAAEGSAGGMSNAAKQLGMPAHWLLYVSVDDIDAAVARVKGNGGKVVNGPMDIPTGGKIAQCMDPQNAAFALFWKGSGAS